MKSYWKVHAERGAVRSLLPAVLVCLGAAVAAYAQSPSGQAERARLVVTVFDQSHLPVPGASVNIQLRNEIIAAAQTDAKGHISFSGLKSDHYTVAALKEDFDEAVADLEWKGDLPEAIEITLSAASHREVVEVHDSVSPVDVTNVPSATISGAAAKDMPARPATVSDALPLIPGIVRKPDGGLQLSGSGEHRSAMLVNSADVTDPATGSFGLTVPIDRVQNLNYYQTAFLAEYGRFSAGLVSVETKRAGEQWKWELNDPFPEFTIRSWHLNGLKTATPRLNFDGPLILRKLYISEGIEYEIRKTPVYTLPFPYNQKKAEGFNSFTQLDWVASDRHLVTATLHFAPQRLGYVNLNYFNPQPTTSDTSTHSYTGTLADKWSVAGGVWENTLSATSYDVTAWPKGPLDYVIQPQINSGNYFVQQGRDAERYSWSSSFLFREWRHWGTHNFKAGSYVAASHEDGGVTEQPIEVRDATGHLLQRIEFTPGTRFHNSDTEIDFYGQDHCILTPKISADLGLRIEYQQISSAVRLAPRAAIAWNPFSRLGTTIRAGVGVFYDHVPLDVYAFDRYPNRIVTLYDGAGDVTAGPTTYLNGLGYVSPRSFIFTRDVAGNFSPISTTGSIYLEQPLTNMVRLRVGYLQTVSSDLIVLDSIAPHPPSQMGLNLLSGDGTAHYRQVDVTTRVRAGGKGELVLSFVHSRATGDLNDFAGYIGSFSNAIIHPNQVATLPTDLPNRFLAWGRVKLGHRFGAAPVFEYRSGTPYSVLNEQQAYAGVPNSSRFPRFLSADARVWRDFKVNENYSVRLAVSGFNLTNHFNPEATHWNTGDPVYGMFFGERHRRFTVDFDVLF
jgi:hypothetical protein